MFTCVCGEDRDTARAQLGPSGRLRHKCASCRVHSRLGSAGGTAGQHSCCTQLAACWPGHDCPFPKAPSPYSRRSPCRLGKAMRRGCWLPAVAGRRTRGRRAGRVALWLSVMAAAVATPAAGGHCSCEEVAPTFARTMRLLQREEVPVGAGLVPSPSSYDPRRRWDAVQVVELNASATPTRAAFALAAPGRAMLAGETAHFRVDVAALRSAACGTEERPSTGSRAVQLRVCVAPWDHGGGVPPGDGDLSASLSQPCPSRGSADFISALPGADGLTVTSDMAEWVAAVPGGSQCRGAPARGRGEEEAAKVAVAGSLHGTVWVRSGGGVVVCAEARLVRVST